jgi:hypothetical protein
MNEYVISSSLCENAKLIKIVVVERKINQNVKNLVCPHDQDTKSQTCP